MTKKTKIARSSGARKGRARLPLGGVARIRMLDELQVTDPALYLRLAAPGNLDELDALIRSRAGRMGLAETEGQ